MKKLLQLMLILTSMAPQGALASNPAFDQAVQNYKARQYTQALVGFQTVLKANPMDTASHYYLALCYQGMNQISLAKQQFEWVAGSKDPQLRAYAASGLAQLQKFPTSRVGTIVAAPTRLASRNGAGAAPHLSGRLKVIEFYTDW